MLFKLLGLPFTLPAAGVRFVFNQLIETAEAELLDDAPVKEALLELQLRLEEGEVSDEEFAEQEALLFQRLREIRAYRQARQRELLSQEPAEESAGPISYRSGSVVVESDLDEEPER